MWPADEVLEKPGVEDSGGGTDFLRPPLPAETGEPDGSMDMRSMRSFRRCCS